MIHLLDVNVLIALGDVSHPHADAALRFFEKHAVREGWATCPLVENAFIRIVGRTNYPGGPGSTGEARRMLLSLLNAPGHQFWPDALSFADPRMFPDLPTSRNLTDLYLLALAVKRGGRLATFDQNIDPSLLPNGQEALYRIPL
ncbi:MAG: VapC toxin family PIN domain ribonuclease [Verrucomicrobia bacterium]|nr:VapC toxin family PIN domain ribonuclease [Verrucomicrobiota bacterium]